MKIVVATDSYKGCLTSSEAGEAIKEAILSVTKADVKVVPIADGGEGTVDALMAPLNGEEIAVTVTGPLGEKVESYYGFIPEKKLAVMEMANVAGITMVRPKAKNPMNTTTYGVGEMILMAAENGCREFIIGIGGSATNDGGLGMLTALGIDFYTENGEKAGIFGRDMMKVTKVSTANMAPVLKECHFTIMCDVTNPLCGEMGSSRIYGPQKGATEKIIEQMDAGLYRYAEIIKRDTGKDLATAEGAGAAGGLGFAFLSFLNTTLGAGTSYIFDTLNLEKEMEDADIVITGEGHLDAQTLMGKCPAGVAKIAKKHGAKVIALAGATGRDAEALNEAGIDAYFSILQEPLTVENAMDKEVALNNITHTVRQIFRLIAISGE